MRHRVPAAVLLIAATVLLVGLLESRSRHSEMAVPATQQRAVSNGGSTSVGWGSHGTPEAIYYWRGALMAPVKNPVAGSESLRVETVEAGSPAAEAGLQPGDVVDGFDAMPITTPGSFALAIADLGGGPVIDLRVERTEVGKGVAVIILHVTCTPLEHQQD